MATQPIPFPATTGTTPGYTTVTDIAEALIELPDLVRLAKWYGIGLGILMLYVAVQVSKR